MRPCLLLLRARREVVEEGVLVVLRSVLWFLNFLDLIDSQQHFVKVEDSRIHFLPNLLGLLLELRRLLLWGRQGLRSQLRGSLRFGHLLLLFVRVVVGLERLDLLCLENEDFVALRSRRDFVVLYSVRGIPGRLPSVPKDLTSLRAIVCSLGLTWKINPSYRISALVMMLTLVLNNYAIKFR